LVSHLTISCNKFTKQLPFPIVWKEGMEWKKLGGGWELVGKKRYPREEETWRLRVTTAEVSFSLGFIFPGVKDL
jgi:hypothetical protein